MYDAKNRKIFFDQNLFISPKYQVKDYIFSDVKFHLGHFEALGTGQSFSIEKKKITPNIREKTCLLKGLDGGKEGIFSSVCPLMKAEKGMRKCNKVGGLTVSRRIFCLQLYPSLFAQEEDF